MLTVFAVQEAEAVAKFREFTLPYQPSSPSIALFKNGELVHFIERHNIEGRSAAMIAQNLKAAYEEFFYTNPPTQSPHPLFDTSPNLR